MSLARLTSEPFKQANVDLQGDTPVGLGDGTLLVAVREPDGNSTEFIRWKR